MTSSILCLDLSTTSTGWSVFDCDTKNLLAYGFLKPKVPGAAKMGYPVRQLAVCKDLGEQVAALFPPDGYRYVVIEEINRHKSRMSGKTLDCLHGFVWDALSRVGHLGKVHYVDSDGAVGWRTFLKLFLSDADKKQNAEAKKLNKKLQRGTRKLPIITKKHLAQRLVNSFYGLSFDVEEVSTDSDICDSIGLGHAFLRHVLPLLAAVE